MTYPHPIRVFCCQRYLNEEGGEEGGHLFIELTGKQHRSVDLLGVLVKLRCRCGGWLVECQVEESEG